MTEEMRDWRELCAAIAKENDPVKSLGLMEKLLAVLDERLNFISEAHDKIPARPKLAQTMPSLTPSHSIQTRGMITGNRSTGRYMVVLVVLVLLSFITVLVWVHKHRTRERRSTINVSCICDMTRKSRSGPVLRETVGPATKSLAE